MPFVENVVEFESWMDNMLKDAKEKLNMTNETIAWILLREGTSYYAKTIGHAPEMPKLIEKYIDELR